MNNKHLISIDYEDWFTTSHYQSIILEKPPISLLEYPTHLILDTLDQTETKATFFVLGIIAERHPKLIEEIKKRGHEIASHGYSHTPLHHLNSKTFQKEIQKTNSILEDIIQEEIIGFRAPFMSITQKTAWAIDILKEEGFKYDSSIYPLKTPMYGVPNAPKNPYYISSQNLLKPDENSSLLEIPITIYNWKEIQFPAIGGIYSRFLPMILFKKTISETAKTQSINFYFHPWELINKNKVGLKTSLIKNLLANYNSEKYIEKIEWMLQHYTFTSFETYFDL